MEVQRLTSDANMRVLKEPRGFIKILEFFVAIFTFATCGGYSTMLGINVTCATGNTTTNVTFGYPFKLKESCFQEIPTCSIDGDQCLTGNFAPSSQFFVTIAVFSFLYTLVAMVIYIFFERQIKEGLFAIIDFLIHSGFCVMFLIASAAWAHGVVQVKSNTDVLTVIGYLPVCKQAGVVCAADSGTTPNYGTISISVVFGFLSLFVWAGNLWFCYKETPWFKRR